MRTYTFSIRTAKEILRDKLNLIFGLGFPLVLLFLLQAIQANIPVELFEISHLVPGVAVFGLSFMTLFSATLISKDRSGALLQRLYTTPMRAYDYILGYTLPLLPIALAQSLICLLASLIFGLTFSLRWLLFLVLMIPVAVFFIALGLLCGSLFTDKQVGGICGALLTNLSAWFSGTWFDVSLVGGWFKAVSNALPFFHAVEMQRAVIAGNYAAIFPHLWWVLGYAVGISLIAVLVFTRKMREE